MKKRSFLIKFLQRTNMYAIFIIGFEERRCLRIKVILTGDALKTHGGQLGQQESPFGPLQGKYYRAPDVCGKPSWFKKTYYNGVYYENQRIWWHGGEECGKKVSKGFSNYWKIGTFWDDNFSLGAMDTLDANPSVQAKIQQTKIALTKI